ncbi:hypothetical protein P3W45_001556 [Vairimorpha bombi]|jgi:polyribonucleotide nucleotidyltransferase
MKDDHTIKKIRKYRLVHIQKCLDNFSILPYTLQTQKYKQYLISTLDKLVPKTKKINIPNNKIGKIIGVQGSNLRNIEKESNCKIKIEKDNKNTVCVITGDTIEDLRRCELIIDDVLCNNESYTFSVDKMSDWEKFYVWWYYFSKKM